MIVRPPLASLSETELENRAPADRTDPVHVAIVPPIEGQAQPALEGAATAAGEFAFTLMRAQYRAMRESESLVRGRDDPKGVHDLRVAVRRLRTALVLFDKALPARAAGYRERLGRFGSGLGALRDLDVLLGQNATWAASALATERDTLDTVGALLDHRRSAARQRVVSALCSAASRRLFESLERFLASGPQKRSAAARRPILDLAPELLGRAYRKLVTIGDHIGPEAPPEALHALRIRIKRLRYAVEFFEPFYGKDYSRTRTRHRRSTRWTPGPVAW